MQNLSVDPEYDTESVSKNPRVAVVPLCDGPMALGRGEKVYVETRLSWRRSNGGIPDRNVTGNGDLLVITKWWFEVWDNSLVNSSYSHLLVRANLPGTTESSKKDSFTKDMMQLE